MSFIDRMGDAHRESGRPDGVVVDAVCAYTWIDEFGERRVGFFETDSGLTTRLGLCRYFEAKLELELDQSLLEFEDDEIEGEDA